MIGGSVSDLARAGSIRYEREGRLAIIVIDRPAACNALTLEMHEGLAAAFDRFATDNDAWVAIVTGSGDKAFCAGSDLKQISNGEMPRGVPWPGGYGGIVSRLELDKPVIAAVNGFAMGGGFEIVLACDIVVASRTATFGLPEPRAGVAAIGGGLLRLPRQIGYKNAMAMILTATPVDAAEGRRLGFVNEVVAPDDLMPAAHRWANAILQNSPMAIRASKDAVRRGLAEPDLSAALAAQWDYPGLQAMWNSDDYREGPKAFAEKRQPQWQGR